MQFLDAHIQTLNLLVQTVTLFVLAFTAGAILWQAIGGGKQAKASERLAQLGMEQTELMRMQVHASFRPIITIASGTYGHGTATLTLKNLGTGAALGIVAHYRSGFRKSVGSLSASETVIFLFDNSLNHNPILVGPPITESGILSAANSDVCLRLEYESVSGAGCWTTVDFKLGREAGTELHDVKLKHGMDSPSLTTDL